MNSEHQPKAGNSFLSLQSNTTGKIAPITDHKILNKKEIFLANANGKLTPRFPVWIMRQAGRYLDDYRKIREKHSFVEICKNPELAARVTVQPVEKFDLDAAIIFSDILFILEPLGIKLEYKPGPEISPILKDPRQFSKFHRFDPADRLSFVSETIARTGEIIGDRAALVGFSGAPFTLFCYLCGSQGHTGYQNAIGFLTNYPEEGEELLALLSDLVTDYLLMQYRAGADVIQLFDTWAGELPESDFDQWARPYLERIVGRLRQENRLSSLYIRGTSQLLDSLRKIDADIFSIDWKTPLPLARRILAPRALQGNLNPAIMLGPQDVVAERTQEILNIMKDYPGFIFNLGHGILPATPEENVKTLVETVHNFRR
jgi:uroporphyrinogen decarboxylase